MSQDNQTKTEPQRKPWLTQAALWLAVIAWGALGIWGWAQTASGLICVVLIGLSISADVLGARLAVHAGQSACRWRAMVCILLAIGCVAFTGFAAKRGFELAQAQGQAPYQAALAERAAAQAVVARIDAAIAAVPALRSDIPAARLRELQAARVAELDRLTAQKAEAQARLDAVQAPPPPPEPLPNAVMWALVALVEALKLFGFWAIGRPADQRQPAKVIAMTAGQTLARQRWGEPRQA